MTLNRKSWCRATLLFVATSITLPASLVAFTAPLPQVMNAVSQNNPSTLFDASIKQDFISGADPTELRIRANVVNKKSGPSPSKTKLNMIQDERREFEINLGRAIDTLKKDYPDMLTKEPDFQIYNDEVDMVDPSGYSLHGLKNYKTFFQVLRSFIAFFYCHESSGLTFRLVYDWARNSIRVSWNAVLIPKIGGIKNKVFVDGISTYAVDRGTGLITKHTVDRLLLNDKPVFAPKGIFYAVTNDLVPVVPGIPAGPIYSRAPRRTQKVRPSTSLKMSSSNDARASNDFDSESFEKKNATRKKYGLPPITPEEFMKIEAEIQNLASRTKQAAQAAAELSRQELQKSQKKSLLSKMFEDVVKDGCESNFDCERPQVCCDFVFKKICCSSGVGVVEPQLQRIPVPAYAGNPSYPDRPGSM